MSERHATQAVIQESISFWPGPCLLAGMTHPIMNPTAPMIWRVEAEWITSLFSRAADYSVWRAFADAKRARPDSSPAARATALALGFWKVHFIYDLLHSFLLSCRMQFDARRANDPRMQGRGKAGCDHGRVLWGRFW